MSDITPETFPEYKKVSPLVGLPEYLKDPAVYDKIERELYDALVGSCGGHGEVIEWAACSKCQQAFYNRGELLRKLGFTSPAQYLAWKKTHQKIRELAPLPKYDE